MLKVTFANPKTNEHYCTVNMDECGIQRGDILFLPDRSEPLVVVQRAIIFEPAMADINNLRSKKNFDVVLQIACMPPEEAQACKTPKN